MNIVEDLKSELKDYLIVDINKCFVSFKSNIKKSSPLLDEVFLIESQYKKVKKETTLGIISAEESSVMSNRIRNALLDIINKIDFSHLISFPERKTVFHEMKKIIALNSIRSKVIRRQELKYNLNSVLKKLNTSIEGEGRIITNLDLTVINPNIYSTLNDLFIFRQERFKMIAENGGDFSIDFRRYFEFSMKNINTIYLEQAGGEFDNSGVFKIVFKPTRLNEVKRGMFLSNPSQFEQDYVLFESGIDWSLEKYINMREGFKNIADTIIGDEINVLVGDREIANSLLASFKLLQECAQA